MNHSYFAILEVPTGIVVN